MSSLTTQLTIINRALQLLGAQPISNLQEQSRSARAMNRAYQPRKLFLLRMGIWNFAKARASIAAAAVGPVFGKSNYFQLPGDFLDLAPPDREWNCQDRDWEIEGTQIASDEAGPLQLKYITSNVVEGNFDACFAEALSSDLAVQTCEEITQSNTKMATAQKIYSDQIEIAKKRNAFEKRPIAPAQDSWISRRS